MQESGNLTTLASYLTLLNEAELLTGLEKYAADIIRKRSSKPKFQVYNNALLSAGQDVSFENYRSNHKAWGNLAESAVGAHLLNSGKRHRFNVYYWNNGNYEVDYVMEKGDKILAVEVKSGKDSINKGLDIFDREFHPDGLFIIGTDGIPFEEFFSMNPVELFNL